MGMKLLACVKRAVDFNVKFRVKPGGLGVKFANVKVSMSPLNEIAVKEAACLKERGEVLSSPAA